VLKVVVDANLVVSAIINKTGTPAKLLQAWRDNVFLLIISDQMLEEIERVLQYPHLKNKYKLMDEEIERVITAIKRFAVILPDIITVDVIKRVYGCHRNLLSFS